MRLHVAVLVASALLGVGLGSLPAAADTLAPVSSISVAPHIDRQGVVSVNVSWTGQDPKADGVVVCLIRGVTAPATPDSCESHVAVTAPSTSSGPITIFPSKTYTVAVYDYIGTTPDPTYSAPVSQLRHGTKLTFQYDCAGFTAGSRCKISSVLKDLYRGTPLTNRSVELWTSGTQKGASWSRIATATTDGTGHARTTVTLTKTRLYQWRYAQVGAHELPVYTPRYEIPVTS